VNNPIATADLWDEFGGELRALPPIFQSFGARRHFAGRVRTVRVAGDNGLVRKLLSSDGADQVLVVDGGGSTACALLGDQIATLAVQNHWSGVLIYGCIRDADGVDALQIAVRALATMPARPETGGVGEVDTPVMIAGIEIMPGDYLYADRDGIVVAERELHLGARG
jgi:regulator of ribonuclease activity A